MTSKNNILFLISLPIISIYSQTEKEKFYEGANSNLNFSKLKTDIKRLNIGRVLAFFINMNFLLELILNYRQIKCISELSNTKRA